MAPPVPLCFRCLSSLAVPGASLSAPTPSFALPLPMNTPQGDKVGRHRRPYGHSRLRHSQWPPPPGAKHGINNAPLSSRGKPCQRCLWRLTMEISLNSNHPDSNLSSRGMRLPPHFAGRLTFQSVDPLTYIASLPPRPNASSPSSNWFLSILLSSNASPLRLTLLCGCHRPGRSSTTIRSTSAPPSFRDGLKSPAIRPSRGYISPHRIDRLCLLRQCVHRLSKSVHSCFV